MIGKGDRPLKNWRRGMKKTYPQHKTADKSHRFKWNQAGSRQTAYFTLLLASITGKARRLLPYHRKMIPETRGGVKGERRGGGYPALSPSAGWLWATSACW